MTKQYKMQEVYSSAEIAQRVQSIANAINTTYAGQELVVICVLKGATIFFADLVRKIELDMEFDFLRVASYSNCNNPTQSTKTVSLTKDVEISLQGKHVLLVEDVIDSGLTMDFLFEHLKARGAASLRLAVLVDKRERREIGLAKGLAGESGGGITADFVGFTLNKGFIVGYGLDVGEQYRQLPGIFEILPG